ncbi:MAG TPA: hypothetical protein VNP96_02145 [Solirubrobacterales bacterium]|nr:hypothetical protein [Solirubrobacterales bacterium]
MLGSDLKVVDGASDGAWIEPALGGDCGAVTEQVPKLFEAYARVFHPASDDQGNPVTWAEVTRQLGRTAHPDMQWHQIVGTADTFGIEHDPLVDAIEAEQGKQPRLELPAGRDHLVLAGPLAAVVQIGDADPPGLISSVPVGAEESWERPEPDSTDPFWREGPSLIWPADHSWFVASEVDFDSTLVGGSRALVDALVAASGLEVHEVQSDTKLTAFSDKLNPVPESEEG